MIKQRTGIPTDFNDVRKAVEEIGYELKRVTGGHYIFKNDSPSMTWGQSVTLSIPTKIKAPRTLHRILIDAGYFKANHLRPDGSPAPEQTADVVLASHSLLDQRRSKAFYAWQKAVKQSLRAGSSQLPSLGQFDKPTQSPPKNH